jgi:hypothetical protein
MGLTKELEQTPLKQGVSVVSDHHRANIHVTGLAKTADSAETL